MKNEPVEHHLWLRRLVGEWTVRSEATMAPDAPPEVLHGEESVRALGDLWVLCEGTGEMPGGGEFTNVMTLGYDVDRARYVGTFVASVMSHLWVYEGERVGDRLTLNNEGPDFTGGGGTAHYRDIVEFQGDDARTMTSEMRRPDGTWFPFMRAEYRRKA
jgi:hypothetical protein